MTHLHEAEALLKSATEDNHRGDFTSEAEKIALAGSIAAVGMLKAQERTNYLLETLVNALGEQVLTSHKILAAVQE